LSVRVHNEGGRLSRPTSRPKVLTGRTIIGELIRNMELGQFELAYTVLLPCVFRAYLNPQDYACLANVLNFVIDG